MKLKKQKLLKSEFGVMMQETLKAAYTFIIQRNKTSEFFEPEKARILSREINDLMGRWAVYRLALKQFYGIDYNFIWTDKYMGVCTDDEKEWLFKIEVGGA